MQSIKEDSKKRYLTPKILIILKTIDNLFIITFIY